MAEKVNCPFCDNFVDKNALKCDKCDAWFKEPNLCGIKFKEFAPFFAINCITFGLFSVIWFFINRNAINKLTDSPTDSLKLNGLFLLLLASIVFVISNNFVSRIATIAILFIIIALSYRVIRILQKYTEKNYKKVIEFNPYYLFLFNIFYLVHFIDTYTDRVLNTHEFFNWKSPYIAFLFALILIQIFMINFYHNVWAIQCLRYVFTLD